MDEGTINLVRNFFFKAMRNGWASPTAKSVIPELPGAKSIPFSDGEFDLLDYYFASPDSDYSYGTTMIWLAKKPVWIMHYGGWYNQNVISFLKRALLRNYNADVFVGGRGPRGLEDGEHIFQYSNIPFDNDFTNFSGKEQIFATSPDTGFPAGTILGEHRYFGGLFM